jgi:hypothetical protein
MNNDALELIITAARAARVNGPAAAEVAAQRVAADLGYSLPGEDFCLHGHYDVNCTICEEIFA